MDDLNLGGRPQISDQTLNEWLSKLEPYLKSGLSLDASCLQAQIPRSTAQRKYDEIDWFREKIDQFKNYQLIIYTNIRIKQLENISKKLQNGEKLTKDDYGVLNWMGENAKSLMEISSKAKIAEEANNKKDEYMEQISNDPRVLMSLSEMYRIAAEKIKNPDYGITPQIKELRETIERDQKAGIQGKVYENLGV